MVTLPVFQAGQLTNPDDLGYYYWSTAELLSLMLAFVWRKRIIVLNGLQWRYRIRRYRNERE